MEGSVAQYEAQPSGVPAGSRGPQESRDPGTLRPLKGVRILAVEDNPEHLEPLELYLRQFGATVKAADTAQEALDHYYAFLPDVIVSDLEMPVVDGFSLMRQLRDAGSSVPAIAVSGHNREEDRRRSRASGFRLHLAKPLSPIKVLEAILSVLPE